MLREEAAVELVGRLLDAWRCCGTCAGGVLAEHDRKVAAQTLREYAAELDWKRPEKSPCVDTEACCGSEDSCDVMQPITRVIGALSLRRRADEIERTATPPGPEQVPASEVGAGDGEVGA